MSETLQLSGELVQQLQEVLATHDPRCGDPLVAVQYMAAVTGYLLACQHVPDDRRREFLEQLQAFMGSVFEDVVAQQRQVPPEPAHAPQEAFGIWRPGDP
ncbi:hypothetical protein ECTPHS_00065 [Ectothiorhodospira sp. PHS-1]|uniref:hypothetical protein n=1 Tax=Ectothiorhodospira sp. PHS-1 TaxID=519989 RepID=UPI00024A83DE|nr:hypothetical protein [Ectothiorhodospira sp. PHS-1]EHQ51048.1 hypothetical protein ECTPHS_00065 [Ectothiorhodospira sp. PHS-1]